MRIQTNVLECYTPLYARIPRDSQVVLSGNINDEIVEIHSSYVMSILLRNPGAMDPIRNKKRKCATTDGDSTATAVSLLVYRYS